MGSYAISNPDEILWRLLNLEFLKEFMQHHVLICVGDAVASEGCLFGDCSGDGDAKCVLGRLFDYCSGHADA